MNFHDFIEIKENHIFLTKKFEYLKNSGIKEYKEEVKKLFKLSRFPHKNDNNIVEQIIPKSLNDYNKKAKLEQYYLVNAVCFVDVISNILTPDFINNFKKYSPDKKRDLFIYNYSTLFHELLFDSIEVLKRYENIVLKRKSKYTIGKNSIQHSFTLYKFIEQMIYGQNSFHSFIDKEINASISIIRQIIELRIRKAFGVLGYLNTNNNSFNPLPMSNIFEILKKYKNNITFAIPLENIMRIYSWANIFVHVGIKDYVWKIVKVKNYIHVLMSGYEKSDGSWSVNNGIALNKNILADIHKEIKNSLPPNCDIIDCKPEADII